MRRSSASWVMSRSSAHMPRNAASATAPAHLSSTRMSRIAEVGGLDVAAALQAIETAAVKDRLRANTDEAIARGAFGAPTFFVGDELFWGNDRLHFVEAALKR